MDIILAKLANFVKLYAHDLFIGTCMILVGIIGFNLGQISKLPTPETQEAQKSTVYKAIATSGASKGDTATPIPTPIDPRVVASKSSSSKVYHHPWCSGAKRIKSANQVWFDNEKAAEAAGYTLAANCQ